MLGQLLEPSPVNKAARSQIKTYLPYYPPPPPPKKNKIFSRFAPPHNNTHR